MPRGLQPEHHPERRLPPRVKPPECIADGRLSLEEATLQIDPTQSIMPAEGGPVDIVGWGS